MYRIVTDDEVTDDDFFAFFFQEHVLIFMQKICMCLSLVAK